MYYPFEQWLAVQQRQEQQRQMKRRCMFDIAGFLLGQAIKPYPVASTMLYAGGAVLAAEQGRPVKLMYEAANLVKSASRL